MTRPFARLLSRTALSILCGVSPVLQPMAAHAQTALPSFSTDMTATAGAAPVSPAMQNLQLQGIAKTLQQYPQQSESILQNYIGVDTGRLDMTQFDAIVARGNAQEIYQEVATLSANRDALNNGTFTGVSYYRDPALVPPANSMADAVADPVADPAPAGDASVIAANPETATMEQATADAGDAKTAAAQHNRSWAEQPYSGTIAGLGVAAAIGVGIASSGGGGGGGGGSDDGNDGMVTPTPTPVDIRFGRNALPDLYTPASFITAEFNAYPLGGLGKEKAQYAYAKGLTGSGVKIGFFDFFSTDASADTELNSRIVYRNLNFAADNAVMAPNCTAYPGDPVFCDHGRVVMQYGAAARDGSGMLGVAYGASLMMESAGPFLSSPVRLSDFGADIVNFSCTGCVLSVAELQYMADQDVLMTSATGNDNNGVNPRSDSPAASASQLDYHLIAVTGVYEVGGGISNAAYNSCGNQSEYCMAAYSNRGTSFAAPQVAGAAALIKQGWNFLSADQIAKILLYSAKDIGVAGVDPVYGHGLLDLQAAVNPVGTLSVLNGQGAAVSYIPSTLALNRNSAFGDAFQAPHGTGQVTLVDSYGRDFAVKTQDHLRVAQQDRFTPDTLNQFGRKPAVRTVKVGNDLSMQFNRTQNSDGGNDMLGYANYEIAPDVRIGMGFATDINNLPSDDTQAFNRFDFIAGDAFRNGFLNFSDNDQVLNQSIEVTPAENVQMKLSNFYSKNTDDDYFQPKDNGVNSDFTSSIVETRLSPADDVHFNFKNGVTHEFNSLLGLQSTGSFAMNNGANTYFTGLDASYDLTPDWNIFASYLVGSTRARTAANSAYSDVSDILSDSFNVTATRGELLGHDALSFSLGQPTRVRSGQVSGLTQQVDRTTGAIQTVGFQQSLVPSGRNLQLQMAYQKALGDAVDLNLAVSYETAPYQQGDAAADASGLAKIVYRFN